MTIAVRLATERDAYAISDLYRPEVERTSISFETVAPDEDEMRRRILETLGMYPWLVCDHDGRVAGYAYAVRHRTRAAYQWSVDTSVYIHADYRRCGIGRGLYTSLLRILAAQGLFNAYAGITLPNPASVALHEVVGFRPLGIYRNVGYKFSAWHDVGWYALALRPHTPSPDPPRSLADVERDPSWPAMLDEGLSFVRIS